MNGANLQPRGSGVATVSSKSSFSVKYFQYLPYNRPNPKSNTVLRRSTPGPLPLRTGTRAVPVVVVPVQCAIGQGTYWLSLLLRILFFHLTTQTLLFFFQCSVSFFLSGYALIPALSACEIRTCYAYLSFFLSSKPEVYTATNKPENASGAAMRMNKL